jgi:hypothetical protein
LTLVSNNRFHEVSNTPALYAINTGLQKDAIIILIKNTKNFDKIGKRRYLEYFAAVQS